MIEDLLFRDMSITSPVTHKSNTRLVDQYTKEDVIELYKAENIDVNRFFEEIKTIDLYECLDTNYRFFFPETIFGDNQFYQDLDKTISGYYHTDRWEHHKAKTFLPAKCSLLEVGCGDGAFLSLAKESCNIVKGLELNSNAIKNARSKGLDVEEITIQQYAEANPQQFDVVCCFQVLEHIYDIHSFLNSMIKSAKPNGILIIAVPNNNPHLFKRDKSFFLNLPPHHAGLWNVQSLTNLQKVFPLSLQKVMYEPLIELKLWYKAQVDYYETRKPLLAKVLKIIPRQIFKPVLKIFRNSIQGKTIMCVYSVSNNAK